MPWLWRQKGKRRQAPPPGWGSSGSWGTTGSIKESNIRDQPAFALSHVSNRKNTQSMNFKGPEVSPQAVHSSRAGGLALSPVSSHRNWHKFGAQDFLMDEYTSIHSSLITCYKQVSKPSPQSTWYSSFPEVGSMSPPLNLGSVNG